jgi:F0F1-type ATP synthase assembly protein I
MNNYCNDKSSSEIDSASESESTLESDDKKIDSQNDGVNFNVYAIAAQVSNVGVEMIMPLLIGVGLDYLFGTVVVFAIIGAISGFVIAFWRRIKIANNLL